MLTKTAVVCLLACVATVFGRPDVDIESRIVGGYAAANGQFPHQVSLQQNNQHFCGGSIISPNKILTAAHCIYGNTGVITVVVGTNKLSLPGVSHNVIRAVYHGDYNPQTIINDVAVLTLGTSIQYGQYVQNITLASLNPQLGQTLILSGWGLTSYPGNIPNDLQYINLQALDLPTCAASLQGASPITTGHVCTTSPVNQGACQGDSGGPLINTNGFQVGIVSWGIPCAKGLPDVFTSVRFYSSWILSQ